MEGENMTEGRGKKPDAEKIRLTNEDLWAINNHLAWQKVRDNEKFKDVLGFLKWLKRITESIDFKAFTELSQQVIDRLRDQWRVEINKARGKTEVDQMTPEALGGLFNAYLAARWGKIQEELQFSKETDIEVEKYKVSKVERPNNLSPNDVEVLLRLFEFGE